jgi:hypothetical protein
MALGGALPVSDAIPALIVPLDGRAWTTCATMHPRKSHRSSERRRRIVRAVAGNSARLARSVDLRNFPTRSTAEMKACARCRDASGSFKRLRIGSALRMLTDNSATRAAVIPLLSTSDHIAHRRKYEVRRRPYNDPRSHKAYFSTPRTLGSISTATPGWNMQNPWAAKLHPSLMCAGTSCYVCRFDNSTPLTPTRTYGPDKSLGLTRLQPA